VYASESDIVIPDLTTVRFDGLGGVSGVTLMYLVVTRYFPGFGVQYLAMTANVNPVTGAAIVDVAKAMADPAVANASWVPLTHPLASKVGWLSVANISSALFGLPLGALTMLAVSAVTKAPSMEMQKFIDEIRKPRGPVVMEEKTA
jgi:cation/acetate symporter